MLTKTLAVALLAMCLTPAGDDDCDFGRKDIEPPPAITCPPGQTPNAEKVKEAFEAYVDSYITALYSRCQWNKGAEADREADIAACTVSYRYCLADLRDPAQWPLCWNEWVACVWIAMFEYQADIMEGQALFDASVAKAASRYVTAATRACE